MYCHQGISLTAAIPVEESSDMDDELFNWLIDKTFANQAPCRSGEEDIMLSSDIISVTFGLKLPQQRLQGPDVPI